MENIENLKKYLSDSVKETFSTTVSMEVLEIEENFEELKEECIISSVGFSGLLEGSFSICVPDRAACQIVSKMLCMEIEEFSNDVVDGISEMANIIAGGVKMKIPDTKYHYNLSTPSAVKGSQMVILHDTDKTSKISLNFIHDDIKIVVAMVYKINEETAGTAETSEDTNKKTSALDALAKLAQIDPNTDTPSSDSKANALDSLNSLGDKPETPENKSDNQI